MPPWKKLVYDVALDEAMTAFPQALKKLQGVTTTEKVEEHASAIRDLCN